MNVTVRPVGPQDWDDWRRLWQLYLEFYETSRSEDVQRQTWARIIAGDRGMFAAIAHDGDGKAVGIVNFLYHAGFWMVEDQVYLNDLYVLPETRGTGAGRALIEHVGAHAQARGVSKVYWLTAENNAPARALYDKLASKTPFVHYVLAPSG
ncbi:GNAT family N-acetyltransferase [Rhodobacteraceae bacterium D3-12]|nr:GNAT family N-acetyltransferase [Rhodobacteraceae bacterium D3-12]